MSSIRDELVDLCKVVGAMFQNTDSPLGRRARDLLARIEEEDRMYEAVRRRARDLLARIEEEDRMYEAVRRSAEYFRLHENEPNTAKGE